MATAGAQYLRQAIAPAELPPPQREGPRQISRQAGVWGGMSNRRPLAWRAKTRGCDLSDRSSVADREPRRRSVDVSCEVVISRLCSTLGGEHAGRAVRLRGHRARRMTVPASSGMRPRRVGHRTGLQPPSGPHPRQRYDRARHHARLDAEAHATLEALATALHRKRAARLRPVMPWGLARTQGWTVHTWPRLPVHRWGIPPARLNLSPDEPCCRNPRRRRSVTMR
jgi:hypothetical protein